MKFKIDNIEKLKVLDKELSELLYQVYVEGGFTKEKVAEKIFEPISVRKRGFMLGARESSNNEFAGMVIIVPPSSTAISLAKGNECELHLLGVKPKYRGKGLGKELVLKAIKYSQDNNWPKIILWTQKSMKEAQNLYESFGFEKREELIKNDIVFIVYER